VSFAAITLCVASQRAIPKVSVQSVIDSVRKVLDTTSYTALNADSRQVNMQDLGLASKLRSAHH
jgi:hypothetical protein